MMIVYATNASRLIVHFGGHEPKKFTSIMNEAMGTITSKATEKDVLSPSENSNYSGFTTTEELHAIRYNSDPPSA